MHQSLFKLSFHELLPNHIWNINLFEERAEMLKKRVEIEEYKGEEVSLLKKINCGLLIQILRQL